MNELDIEHRLTEMEQRTKSNTHRIDKLEPIVDEIHTMSNTMIQLVQEVKYTNKAVVSLDEKVERMDNRVDEMEKAPVKKFAHVKESVWNNLIGTIVGFFIAGIVWAAVQAF